ncbi:hypothetical protein EVAR_69309_1 [Eumeta japonica]|uniref:ASD2 domain-containing protein n=1 Tax=Eumeta variegata TaxID=151549 RepID=A0A4C1ZXW8_EUMVA|nr:hypothetical protein EVAR_69309_1 [Eumeta japonica]
MTNHAWGPPLSGRGSRAVGRTPRPSSFLRLRFARVHARPPGRAVTSGHRVERAKKLSHLRARRLITPFGAGESYVNVESAILLKDLNTKRSKLEEQMTEARSLKADIYKRGRELDAALATVFNDPERLHETRVFITNKALFNIRAKHLSHRLDTARDTLRLLQKYFTANEDADR